MRPRKEYNKVHLITNMSMFNLLKVDMLTHQKKTMFMWTLRVAQ